MQEASILGTTYFSITILKAARMIKIANSRISIVSVTTVIIALWAKIVTMQNVKNNLISSI